MKLAPLFVLSLGLTLGFSFAEEAEDSTMYTGRYLAAGLTEENGVISGWYDAEKTKAKDADDMMCYAASAANLIAWWQNSSFAVASEAPKDLETIWGTFVNNNQLYNDGGIPHLAINWWMSGVYAPYHYTPSSGADAGSNNTGGTYAIAPEGDPMWERVYVSYNDFIAPDGKPVEFPITLRNYKKDDVYFAGYYYDQYGLTKQDLVDFLVTEWVHPSFLDPADPDTDSDGHASIYDIDFASILEDSVISLAINSDDGSIAHAITLWGVEYDENGNLTTLWLTDSDDYINRLFSVAVTLDDKADKIYFGKLVEGEDGTSYYVSEDYDGLKNIYISQVLSLDTSLTAGWQLIPEPTTATLSLMALAALAARRRRK